MAEDREGSRRTTCAGRAVSLGGLAGLELTPGPGTTRVCQMGALPATHRRLRDGSNALTQAVLEPESEPGAQSPEEGSWP